MKIVDFFFGRKKLEETIYEPGLSWEEMDSLIYTPIWMHNSNRILKGKIIPTTFSGVDGFDFYYLDSDKYVGGIHRIFPEELRNREDMPYVKSGLVNEHHNVYRITKGTVTCGSYGPVFLDLNVGAILRQGILPFRESLFSTRKN